MVPTYYYEQMNVYFYRLWLKNNWFDKVKKLVDNIDILKISKKLTNH